MSEKNLSTYDLSRTGLALQQEAFASALLDSRLTTQMQDHCDVEPNEMAQRLAIYRGNLRTTWCAALKQAFPVVARLVGDDFFESLARDYGRAYPSKSGNLHLFGEFFARFLAEHSQVQDYPYFSHVARLEWQVHTAYEARDDRCLSLADFLSRHGEQAQQARLQFHPSVGLFQSNFAAVDVWFAHQHQEVLDLSRALSCDSYAVVVRPVWQVQVHELTEPDWQALHQLDQGHTLASALEAALLISPEWEIARHLADWFEWGLFVGSSCQEPQVHYD